MGGVSANARKYIIAQAFSEFVTKQCRHSVLHFGKFACEVSDCFYRVLASVHGRRPVRPKARAAGGILASGRVQIVKRFEESVRR